MQASYTGDSNNDSPTPCTNCATYKQLPAGAPTNTVKSASVGEKKAAFTFTWTLTQSGTGADRTAG